jgi:hypothetical protein
MILQRSIDPLLAAFESSCLSLIGGAVCADDNKAVRRASCPVLDDSAGGTADYTGRNLLRESKHPMRLDDGRQSSNVEDMRGSGGGFGLGKGLGIGSILIALVG